MTNTLAPGPLMGLAPPADVTAGAGSKSARSGQGPPGESFASLLSDAATTVAAMLGRHGGETGPPDGGALSMPDATHPTDLLARLAALMTSAGTDPPDVAATEATTRDATGLSLLDRPAGAGGTNEQADGSTAVEALMAFLVMAQRVAEPVADSPLTVTLRDLLAANRLPAGGEFEGGGAVIGAMAATTDADAGTLRPTAIAGLEVPAGDLEVGKPVVASVVSGASDDVSLLADGAPDDTAGAAVALTADADGIAGNPLAGRRDPSPGADGAPATRAISNAAHEVPDVLPSARTPDANPTTDFAARTADGRDGSHLAAAVVTPPAALPVEVTSAARTVNAATVPADVADVVTSAVLRGDSEVRLVLNPPELGEVKVNIVTQQGALRIVVEAAQSGARDLMERALPALLQALEARDLKVDRIEVRAADTGRGSLDTPAEGGAGDRSDGGAAFGRDGEPEWSPVASMDGARSTGADGAGQTGGQSSEVASGRDVADGHVDVLA